MVMSICFKTVYKTPKTLPDVLYVLNKGKLLFGFRSDKTRAMGCLIGQEKRALQITPCYTSKIFLYLLCFTLNTSLQNPNIACCNLTCSLNIYVFALVTDLVHC